MNEAALMVFIDVRVVQPTTPLQPTTPTTDGPRWRLDRDALAQPKYETIFRVRTQPRS